MVLIQKTNDFSRVQDIRIKIFNKELGLSTSDIFNNDDDEVLEQFLILNDGIAVGTFRLRDTGNYHKIERMGILSKYSSKGFGKLALDEIKSYSRKAGKPKIILDSIYDVRDFYSNAGFVQTGDVYSKVGIPHVKMYFEL